VSGKVDFVVSQFLSKIFKDVIKKGNYKIVFDMSEVTYMGSNGFSMLIRSLIKCRENGGDLKLFGVSDDIKGVLIKLKLDNVFSIFNDMNECLGDFYKNGRGDV
jgi:anti-anti-sigma factor